VQIDKTLGYEYKQQIPVGKGYFFERRHEPLVLPDLIKTIAIVLGKVGDRFFGSDVSIVRTVVMTTTLACFVMGYISDDRYFFQTIAYIQGWAGVLIIGASYTPIGAKNIRYLGNAYIYSLNICNVANIGLSHFVDKISYQFIIYFFVTNLFFNRSRDLIISIVLISTMLFITATVMPFENSTSLSDFFLSYVISAFALAVLMLKRFKTEAQLAESELQYRLLAENSADIICTHKASGEFDFVSPSVAALTGYQSAELMGKSAIKFIFEKDRSLYQEKLAHARFSGVDSEAIQYRFLAKNGQYIWLETVIRRIDDAAKDGRFLSQTRSFQKHREYLDQIEHHTAELQDSYKDLEMFAYISSHDMQEPLRMISNYMQLLKRKYGERLDKDAMDYIDYAVKGASNLQALIKDLLSYSTINKKEINLIPVDMDSLLDDVLSGLQLLIQERNVKVFINEPMRPVLADKNAIKQLVQNLIQNGIKYNTSETPVIRIICTEDDKYITYCIQDNGIGIDQQYAQQIFEPFRRLHNKHNFPGTGLGLSICRKIIDRLHGKIWVDSEPGVGSSFYFSIPKSLESLN
jgi:PAS domain S-box-containing protein